MPEIGDKIQVKPEIKELLEKINEESKDAHTAFRKAASWLNTVDEKFWAAIREAHPELDGHDLMYNHKTGEIRITGRIHSSERG